MLTYDDLRSCYLCRTTRAVDQLVLLDSVNGEMTFICRDKAACKRAWSARTSDSAPSAEKSPGDFVSFRPGDTATGARRVASSRLTGAGSSNPFADPWLWAMAFLFIIATLALIAGAKFTR